MNPARLTGHFIAGGAGPVFVLLREPPGTPKGGVLVVPPFAEEMNKCRRMVTEVGHRLCAQGWVTVLPDLYGTGDSAGEFAEARWATWRDDLSATVAWAATRGVDVSALLAIRLGAALAESLVAMPGGRAFDRTVLWQPVFDGARFLNQFLRLRTAASLMEDRKESVTDLRKRLESGATVEVGGYELPGALARDLENASAPEVCSARLGRVTWMELKRDSEATLPAPSAKMIERTRGAGAEVEVGTFVGEPFWSSTEIVVNPAMVDATARALTGA